MADSFFILLISDLLSSSSFSFELKGSNLNGFLLLLDTKSDISFIIYVALYSLVLKPNAFIIAFISLNHILGLPFVVSRNTISLNIGLVNASDINSRGFLRPY